MDWPFGKPDFFNHGRLLEDLLASSTVFLQRTGAGRAGLPWPALSRIGNDVANAQPGDLGALQLKNDPRLALTLAKLPGFSALGGVVHVNAWLASIVAGRLDLAPRMVRNHRLDADAALRWLVLHGVHEHDAWTGLTSNFIKSLNAPLIRTRKGALPPLARLMLDERPELAGAFTSKDQFSPLRFREWMHSFGQREHGLGWVLPGPPAPGLDGSGGGESDMFVIMDAMAAETVTRADFPLAEPYPGIPETSHGAPALFAQLLLSDPVERTRRLAAGAVEATPDGWAVHSPKVAFVLPSGCAMNGRLILKFVDGDRPAGPIKVFVNGHAAPEIETRSRGGRNIRHYWMHRLVPNLFHGRYVVTIVCAASDKISGAPYTTLQAAWWSSKAR